jgi:hypothetical protein
MQIADGLLGNASALGLRHVSEPFGPRMPTLPPRGPERMEFNSAACSGVSASSAMTASRGGGIFLPTVFFPVVFVVIFFFAAFFFTAMGSPLRR